MAVTPAPTLEDIDRIAALPDPVIRNLQITQCYHELAQVLATRASLAAPTGAPSPPGPRNRPGRPFARKTSPRTLESHLGSQEAARQAGRGSGGAAVKLGGRRSCWS